MKKLIGLICFAFLSVACDEIDGTLTVQKAFEVKDKKGKIQTVRTGYLKTVLDLDQEDRELEIKIEKGDGSKDVKLKVPVPGNIQIPGFSGQVELSGNLTDQPFDLGLNVDTQYSQSPVMQSTESCSFPDRRWVCRWVTDKKTNTKSQVCGYETFYRNGRKQVEFYTVSTRVSVEAEFRALQSSEKLADFAGTRTDTRRITTYEGPCYPNW